MISLTPLEIITYFEVAGVVLVLLLWHFRCYKAIRYVLAALCAASALLCIYATSVDVSFAVLLVGFLCASACLVMAEPDAKLGHVAPLVTSLIAVLGYAIIIAKDLITLLCVWLCVSVLTAVLILRFGNISSLEAGAKYIVFSALGASLLIVGIVLCLTQIGTSYTMLGTVLIVLGIAYELGLVPVHVWLPDVYLLADKISVSILASAVKILAAIALLKFLMIATPSTIARLAMLFAILAAVSMTLGNVAALLAEKREHILAFSTIAQTGYAFIALACMSKAPISMCLAVFLYQIIASAIAKYLLFLAIPTRYEVYTRTSVLIGALSLIGIPPTLGFWPKLFLFLLALYSGQLWLAILLIINTAISVPYYIRLYRMYSTNPSPHICSRLISGIVITCALMLIILGVAYPTGILKMLGTMLLKYSIIKTYHILNK